jgi:hypothetical protein
MSTATVTNISCNPRIQRVALAMFEGPGFDARGAKVRAHIAAIRSSDSEADEHRREAGRLLADTREALLKVSPRGQWGLWCKRHDISDRYARELIQRLNKKADKRIREKQAQKDAGYVKVKAAVVTAVSQSDQRSQLHQLVDGLPEADIQKVISFIETLKEHQ